MSKHHSALRRLTSAGLGAVLLLTACSDDSPDTANTSTAAPTSATSTSAPSPTGSATPAETASPAESPSATEQPAANPELLTVAATASVTNWDPVASFSTEALYMANLYEPLLWKNNVGAAEEYTRHWPSRGKRRGRQELDVQAA
jgi:hypothetical protein